MSTLLTGASLIERIESTGVHIKCLRIAHPPRKIEPKLAVLLVRQGVYVGKANSVRVIYIREVDPREHIPADHHYRDGRAVLPAYGVTNRTVDCWVRSLQRRDDA